MYRIVFLLCLLIPGLNLAAETPVGLIASLSSFAASYGQAVLDGAKLAEDELRQKGSDVKLYIEDDGSEAKNTVSAYQALKANHRIKAVIGGSWWINTIVKASESNNIPLLSCETLFNRDVVLGKNYFILQGHLVDWVKVYTPLIERLDLKRGAIVRFVSGFGATLEDGMRETFSSSGRELVASIEYADIQMPDAALIATKLRKLNPQVLYIDAQPSGLVNLLRRMSEQGLSDATIITNSILADVLNQKLIDLRQFPNLYFTKRQNFSPDYRQKFVAKYSREPTLNSDLGYSALHLAVAALKNPDPVATLKNGINLHGRVWSFNENNVYSGVNQEVWRVLDNKVVAIN